MEIIIFLLFNIHCIFASYSMQYSQLESFSVSYSLEYNFTSEIPTIQYNLTSTEDNYESKMYDAIVGIFGVIITAIFVFVGLNVYNRYKRKEMYKIIT